MNYDIEIYSASSPAQSYYVWDEMMTNRGIYGSSFYLPLFSEGCQFEGERDCAAACSDIEALWNSNTSILTLHNCAIYPILIQLYNGNNLTSSALEDMQQFNIIPDSEDASKGTVLSTCIRDFCDTTDAKNTPGCHHPYSTPPNTITFGARNCTGQETDTYGDTCNTAFNLTYNPYMCVDVARDLGVNLDISGIGMLVAYIIQVGVVLLTCLMWHCLQDWGKLAVFFHVKLWRRSKDPMSSADKAQAKLKKSKLYASFVKALAEFQKAQVFFLAAVLVAALIAWFNPTVLSDEPEQQQLSEHDKQRSGATLMKNFNILIDLAYAGSFPIVLGLLALRNAGKRDTYTLVISSFPLILAVIILISTGGEAVTRSQVMVMPSDGPESCAKVKPTDYCFPSTYNLSMLAKIGGGPITICFFVMLCIVLERMELFKDRARTPLPARSSSKEKNVLTRFWGRFVDSTAQRQNIFEALRDYILQRQRFWVKYERNVQDRRWLRWLRWIYLDTGENILHIVSKVLILAAEITLGAFNVVLLHEYSRIIRPKEYCVSDFQVWSLGQVIAVTVCFPVLVEFVWDCYDGIAKTLESRILPDSYRVVKVDPAAPSTPDTSASVVQLNLLPPIGPYEQLQTDYSQP